MNYDQEWYYVYVNGTQLQHLATEKTARKLVEYARKDKRRDIVCYNTRTGARVQ